MKVGELCDFLSKINPMAEVVIYRDAKNYGYGYIDQIIPGIFQLTEFGNDFHPDQEMLLFPDEVRAICLVPEDYEDSSLNQEIKLNG